jgi:hypothetical protein
MVKERPSHSLIDAWRRRISWITLAEAITLLEHLGGFELDKIIFLDGIFHTRLVCELTNFFSPTEFCINIRPVYFYGGPVGGKRFKGSLVTLLLDRILLVSHERGEAHALKMVTYARCFGKTDDYKSGTGNDLTSCI